MRYAHLLLLCLVLAPACDDETAVGPLNVPEPRTRSELVVCTDQPQLGDTWELPFEADHIQLDAEGNVYLLGRDAPDCATGSSFDDDSWRLLTKLGPRGEVRWVRGWRHDDVSAAVSPVGRSVVLVGEDEVFSVGADGDVVAERRRDSLTSAKDATASDFLLAGAHFEKDPISFDGVTVEPVDQFGLFVIALDHNLVPRVVLQPPRGDDLPHHPNSIVGLSDGDAVVAYQDEAAFSRIVITRIGARSWKADAPTFSHNVRLLALEGDSIIAQVGTTITRYSPEGAALWSRDYAGSLNVGGGSYSEHSVAGMIATASPTRLAIAFSAGPSGGPIETTAGEVLPDGYDIGFATLDLETGLFERVTLEPVPGDQFLTSPALDPRGAMVLGISEEMPDDRGVTRIVRFPLYP